MGNNMKTCCICASPELRSNSGAQSDQVVWAVAAWVSVTAVWAAPSNVQDLKVEHREDSLDISSNLPSATNDMFMWNGPDGSYRFGMQGQDQWRVESRDANGEVTGRYVYRTPDGQTVDIFYGAGTQGYRAIGDAIPGGAAPLTQDVGDQRISDESILSPVWGPDPAYGALLKAGQETQFPNGDGVTTYTDNDAGAIITDVKPQYLSSFAVYPVLNIPGTNAILLGPPLVNDEPLQPAAIPV